ncbi:4'-phosphopantetheinyl transferase family protein [Streptomyces sp. NPDC057375]|uniref:4'-phosphopantetheinyl transferase family protein n=1 Tax=Streptomyces sp. NPDC057375 TaxID=3346109 RepID=UPI0036423007
MSPLKRTGISEPLLMPGPDSAWSRVRQSVAWHGHVVVHASPRDWLPAAVADPRLRALLGARDWQRLTGLPDAEARGRFAASRLLVKYTAGAALQVPPESVELASKAGGRPYLRGCDQIEVSLSHTRDLVVVGLNRRGRIGVDAELAGRRIQYSAVQRHLCTPAERRRLSTLDPDERQRHLVRTWTLKEAYTKALGQGMRMGFTQFGFDADATTLLTPRGEPASHGEWDFATFELDGGHLVGVACHDAGLLDEGDTAVSTMLDEGFVSEVVDLVGRVPHRASYRGDPAEHPGGL